jgi:hypothetical protein
MSESVFLLGSPLAYIENKNGHAWLCYHNCFSELLPRAVTLFSALQLLMKAVSTTLTQNEMMEYKVSLHDIFKKEGQNCTLSQQHYENFLLGR